MKVDFPDPSAPKRRSSNTTLGFLGGLFVFVLFGSGSGEVPGRQQPHRDRRETDLPLLLMA